MERALPQHSRSRPSGLLASALLHCLVLALAAILVSPRLPHVPEEATVEVEIVSLPRPHPPAPASAVEQHPERERDLPSVNEPRRADDPYAMIEARSFHAAHSLAEPRSRQALEEWRKLFPDERIIQLCNLEAMEQVHAWKPDLQPRLVVAYAFSDVRLAGEELDAAGAAMRIDRKWFAIRYHCRVAPDIESVVAFAFAMSEEIPEAEWETHMLPTGDDETD